MTSDAKQVAPNKERALQRRLLVALLHAKAPLPLIADEGFTAAEIRLAGLIEKGKHR